MGISFAFAVLAFPKKVKEAYEVASQTVEQLQRPLYAISYGSLGSLDSKALELTRRLHRGSGICVIRQEMVDLSRDGWRADLLVEYALSPSGPALKCGEKDAERDAARYLAVFIPVSFSFRNAGTAGGNLPSEWVAEDGFLFRYWRETDFHQVNVWYVYNGRLIDPEAVIELTDLDSDSGYVFQFTYSTIQRGSYRLGDPRRSFSH